jgi:hypothetical protein
VAHLSVIALSINGGIKTLGSYAGLAAVVALALLALLYFAQARELKRLREWIEHEAQRPRAPAPARVGVPAPPPPRGPAPAPVSPGPLATGVASTPATPLLATTVEGVRRVPLPGAGAGAAVGTVVMPGGVATPSAPDATTVNEPGGLDEALPPVPAAQTPRLVADSVGEGEPGSAHDVGEGLVIGRAKGVSIRLSDPLVSGRHARVAPDGDDVSVEDLGSTNGTFLNGAQLSAQAVLSNGDRIRVGESEFVFESVPAVAPPAAPTEPPPEVGGPPPAPGAAEEGAAADDVQELEGAPADDADEVQGSSAAVPLLATRIPERTLQLEDQNATDAAPLAPPPPPAPPAPYPARPAGTGAVRLPPAPVTRMSRGGADEDRADESPRHLRHLPRWDGRLPGAIPPGRRLALGGIVLALAAIVVVVVLLGSGGGPKGNSAASAGSSSPPASANSSATHTAPAPSSITVAVLNGTTTTGLAGQLSAKLVGDGFAKGGVADAPSQTAATTTVGYTKGKKVAADEVANRLRISLARVVPVTSANDAAASAAGTHPQVVVTIGVKHPQ